MKKLAIVLFSVVCVAMFIAPSFAEDRLSMSGAYRVRAWDKTSHSDSDTNYIDQRLRIATKINVADDVSLHMRADYGEGTWGSSFTRTYSLNMQGQGNTAIQIDRAYAVIDKEMWTLTVGEQYLGLGNYDVLDINATAAKLRLKLPIETSLIYVKDAENGNTTDDGATEDVDVYALNFSYDSDSFSADLFGVALTDDRAVDNSPMMFGIDGNASLGMVNLTGMIALASGDDGAGKDYVGTEFFLQADLAVSDTVNLGGQLLYALGTDEGDETQLTNIGNWDSFTPTSYNSPFNNDWSGINWESPFDPTGASAGVQGFTVFGNLKVMEGLSLGGLVGYLDVQEDSIVDDDFTIFNAWASYMLASNTELAVAYFYSDQDSAAEDETALVARLQVSF